MAEQVVLSRRGFLGGLAAAVALPVVPKVAPSTALYSGVDPGLVSESVTVVLCEGELDAVACYLTHGVSALVLRDWGDLPPTWHVIPHADLFRSAA